MFHRTRAREVMRRVGRIHRTAKTSSPQVALLALGEAEGDQDMAIRKLLGEPQYMKEVELVAATVNTAVFMKALSRQSSRKPIWANASKRLRVVQVLGQSRSMNDADFPSPSLEEGVESKGANKVLMMERGEAQE